MGKRRPGSAKARDRELDTLNGSDEFSVEEWEVVEEREVKTPGLASAVLHHPRRMNASRNCRLDASLILGIASIEQRKQRRTVCIGVRAIVVAIESESYQPAKLSMHGEREQVDGVTRVPDGIEISGPHREWDCLVGDLLGDQHLAVIEPISSKEGPVSVTLAAQRLGFKVGEVSKSGSRRELKTTREQEAVLDLYIARKGDRDGAGRVVLARSTRRKREPQQ